MCEVSGRRLLRYVLIPNCRWSSKSYSGAEMVAYELFRSSGCYNEERVSLLYCRIHESDVYDVCTCNRQLVVSEK